MNSVESEAIADYSKTPFYRQMVVQLRALDSYGTYDTWTDDKVIAPLILTKDRRQEIPIIGDPDEIVISRIKAYYNALSSSIEKATGNMAVPLINLTHEGFGRAVIYVGRLLVVNKTLRDAHRFGFSSVERLCVDSARIVDNAAALIKKFPEVAEA